MNVLGIDPAKNGEHHCAYRYAARVLYNHGMLEDIVAPDVIIVEQPVNQGGPRAQFALELCKQYGALVERLKHLYPDAQLYTPPANVIRRQAGYNPRVHGKADAYVRAYLEKLGYDMKYWSNPDKRDALMCALWNFKHPDNQEWREK